MVDRTLLPSNATAFERTLAATFEPIQAIPVPLEVIVNPWTCPLGILPWLAWQRRVPEWDASWSEVQKRTVVANAFPLHRLAATRWAVVTAISQLGFSVQHQCWFEYGDSPHRFRLQVALSPLQVWTNDNDASLVRLALRAKGAHDRLVAVDTVRTLPASEIKTGAVLITQDDSVFSAVAAEDVVLPPARVRMGAALLLQDDYQFAGAA